MRARGELRLACAALIAVGCARSDPPRLHATALPAAAAGRVAAVTLQVRNVGGRTLELGAVVPGCGCVPRGRLPATLAPGASATLDLECRAPATGAPVACATRVRSSDPANPEQVVVVTVPGAGTGPDPAAVYLGYVAVGESVARDVLLPAPVALERIAPPADGAFAVEPLPARRDGAAGVRVRFTARRPGVVRSLLDLGPAGRLPVTAVGYAGFVAVPAELRVPAVPAPSWPAITLLAVGGAPLDVGRIEYPPGLGGEIRPLVPGRQVRLVLRSRGPAVAGGEIRVHPATGSSPLVTIPVLPPDAGLDGPPA